MILALSLLAIAAASVVLVGLISYGQVKQIDSAALLLAKRRHLRAVKVRALHCDVCGAPAFHSVGFFDYCDPCWKRRRE